ncbi:hypothetical protein A1Q2_02926 [Trichosporon asahii var. asahii CBS 8904]|uniref:Uncharacterized protein n=1 Tax=Trichosporon asahii var. asahii (strain CBS 8904) TaxID=1220162 RepID=K1VQ20_TRIAC|nr:hypothetical protein A1Q2_02926 [Trichosporon asahii var. asahii CBS 8904]
MLADSSPSRTGTYSLDPSVLPKYQSWSLRDRLLCSPGLPLSLVPRTPLLCEGSRRAPSTVSPSPQAPNRRAQLTYRSLAPRPPSGSDGAVRVCDVLRISQAPIPIPPAPHDIHLSSSHHLIPTLLDTLNTLDTLSNDGFESLAGRPVTLSSQEPEPLGLVARISSVASALRRGRLPTHRQSQRTSGAASSTFVVVCIWA